ncbi:MAG: amino acid ABC transporter permease [Chloroflexota bacterium]|nr:amino acid ABC transporter permease [Chloroflexota bacterium]
MELRHWQDLLTGANLAFIAQGLGATLLLSLASIVISFVVGLAFALGRISRLRVIRWPATAYVEGVRALPVLLLIVFFGVKGSSLLQPIFGEDFELPTFWAGVLGLSMYTSSVLAEIIRAGIVSLPRGQTEASRALGLSYPQTMRHVILPQALRAMVPAMMAQLTTIIKDTSLVAALGVSEMLHNGQIIYNRFNNPVETFVLIALVYFVVCFALSQASRRLELGRAPRKVREIQLRDQAA